MQEGFIELWRQKLARGMGTEIVGAIVKTGQAQGTVKIVLDADSLNWERGTAYLFFPRSGWQKVVTMPQEELSEAELFEELVQRVALIWFGTGVTYGPQNQGPRLVT